LIVAVLAVDPLVGRREAARLEGLRGVPGVSEAMGPGSDPLFWAELGVGARDMDRALGRRIVKPGPKAKDRQKGTIDHEDPESII
jgi:hypothetical protein